MTAADWVAVVGEYVLEFHVIYLALYLLREWLIRRRWRRIRNARLAREAAARREARRAAEREFMASLDRRMPAAVVLGRELHPRGDAVHSSTVSLVELFADGGDE